MLIIRGYGFPVSFAADEACLFMYFVARHIKDKYTKLCNFLH
jgi:hypothetical protein